MEFPNDYVNYYVEANAAWYRVHRMAGVTCRLLSVCFAASQEAARLELRMRQGQELQELEVTTHETRLLRVAYRGALCRMVPHRACPLGASRLRPTLLPHALVPVQMRCGQPPQQASPGVDVGMLIACPTPVDLVPLLVRE